jgi:WXXGXW repeat (2 copies)
MRISFYMLALVPLAFLGCAEAPPTTVTTTTTTQEVTTTTPGAVPVAREVFVTQAPPAVRIEAETVSPGPRYIWTRGYWRWTGTSYVWVPGSWVVRPRPAAVWVQGHWIKRPGGWVWVAGHWQ